MADTKVTFPRISTKLVQTGQWVADPEWYRFWELLWQRTGGDLDFVQDGIQDVSGLQTQINTIKAYTLNGGTDLLINGYSSRQLLNAPLTFELTETGVLAGTYGAAGLVPVVTVDAKGRVQDVTEVAVDPGDFFVEHLLSITPGVLLDVGDGSYLNLGEGS